MELLEIEEKQSMEREAAADLLRQIADSLSRHNGLDFTRQRAWAQWTPIIGKDYGALHGISKLPYISGPMVGHHHVDRRRQPHRGLPWTL